MILTDGLLTVTDQLDKCSCPDYIDTIFYINVSVKSRVYKSGFLTWYFRQPESAHPFGCRRSFHLPFPFLLRWGAFQAHFYCSRSS